MFRTMRSVPSKIAEICRSQLDLRKASRSTRPVVLAPSAWSVIISASLSASVTLLSESRMTWMLATPRYAFFAFL